MKDSQARKSHSASVDERESRELLSAFLLLMPPFLEVPVRTRGQEQALRSRLRSRPLNAPFVIVLRSSRCALGIPLHPLTPVPLQAPALY